MPLLIRKATATEKPHIVGQRSATVRQQRGSDAEGDRLGIVGIEPARCRLLPHVTVARQRS